MVGVILENFHENISNHLSNLSKKQDSRKTEIKHSSAMFMRELKIRNDFEMPTLELGTNGTTLFTT